MSIHHNGFEFICDVQNYSGATGDGYCPKFNARAQTERTAIAKARAAGWAIVRIRITAGASRRTPSVNLVICPSCKHVVGL